MRGVSAVLGWLTVALIPASAMQESAGQKLYLAHCAACHGRQGEGGRGVALTASPRTADNDSLFAVIRKGIPGTEMPPAPLDDKEVREIVVYVRGLQRAMVPKVAPAASPGEQVYRSAGCAQCHAIGGEGGPLGPDLSNIGSRRTPEYLRRAVLDPEADIPENFGQYRWVTVIPDNFLQVRAVTLDGQEVTGARINEDTFSIQVRDGSGKVHSFWKTELRDLRKDWGKSPMPSVRGKLPAAEIEQLVAYLSTLRGGR
jgi:putative heme-binding domain-containing protein